ncbi:MAG: hypothetical protein S4CHLAM45_14340 [Chlamydiales bacterium]|nr:hypothetical protein [Chlamydiales bacterium]MCH9620057.1 hypothetical protein [Chlamydiales bacterium]MCH9623524.1 hypothetical protein [Chlamydiales bacterium]
MLQQPNQAHLFKTSYLLCYALNAPLFAIYSLMAFILYKDLNASVFQITTLVAIKPIAAVLSSYWSDYFSTRDGRIKINIIGAMLLGLFPTFFFPFFNNGWLLIIAFSLYFFAERAVIPTWMELIKISFPQSQQSSIVAYGSLIMFIASAIFPLMICPWLDKSPQAWRWIFPLLGTISLMRLSILLPLFNSFKIKQKEIHFKTPSIITPLKKGWKLLFERPDFAYYQSIFFCGGLGLMIMQPCLPKIIQSNLKLSYTEIATAVALCKGIGFVAAMPIWTSRLHKTNIFKYCSIVTLFAACSIILILLSKYLTFGIYAAFILYGIMQAGSQLSWQLGGPIFSPKHDSSSYTSVNVILVGIRGCIGPILGGILCARLGSSTALVIGSLFCFLGFYLGFLGSKKVPILHQA